MELNSKYTWIHVYAADIIDVELVFEMDSLHLHHLAE